ncbi:hypothetical protein MYCO108962_23510 [Mycobacterium colombiense]
MSIVRPGAQRSTSSGGQGSAPITSAADSRPCGDSIRTADGVWLKTVTFSATSRAWNSIGERATESGTTTSRPPCSSAPQISHTEKSKAYEWNWVHTWSADSVTPTACASNSRVTLRWLTATPLGTPVVPDV